MRFEFNGADPSLDEVVREQMRLIAEAAGVDPSRVMIAVQDAKRRPGLGSKYRPNRPSPPRDLRTRPLRRSMP